MQTPIIEVKNISKEFEVSGTYALKDLSLTVNSGEIYGIIGMSGAGKTTLLRCLTGLEKPDEGSIFIQGKDITKLTEAEIRTQRKDVGVVFQHFNLFSSRTAAENIAYALEIFEVPSDVISKRVDELLHLVGLAHKRDSYPSQMSGGEKQRIGIARALANHPSILLCDEPTSALDAKTTRSILKLLKDLHQKLGVALVIITHHLDVVKQICSQVLVLEKGSIVEKGPLLDIFTQPQHPTTRHLVSSLSEHIPSSLLKDLGETKRLVRLCFVGDKAKEPVISRLMKTLDIEVNILLGNVEYLENTLVGNLVVELSGPQEVIAHALEFLENNHVQCEVVR
jgi:D-methionine transport system ATP-binding protein